MPGFIRRLLPPRLAAVCRAPQIITKKRLLLGRLEAEIEKISHLIRLCHWIAAKDVILENTGKRPVYAGIRGITPTSLSEVGVDAIELPPGNYHLTAIRRINRDGRLVRCIAQDVVAVSIDVHLMACEDTELRNHPRRSLYFSRRRRRHVVLFQRLVQRQPAQRRQRLSRNCNDWAEDKDPNCWEVTADG